MTDYVGLLQGHFATTDAILGQVLSWLNDERPGTAKLKGHGNYVDAWRHGGTAALLAYHHGYDNVKRWGDALEDYRPDNEQEFRQDVRNNEVGAKIGALARITGMTIPELGDAVKAAFKAGAFQTDAYAPFSGGQTFQVGNMKISIGSGVVSLPDGSRFDLTKSTIIPVDGVEYPVLHVIRKDGSVQNMWTNMEDSRTLFQGGVGKWELSQDGNASSASFNDRFSGADGAPYNALTYVPVGSDRQPRPVPHLAQTREAERLVAEQNPANPARLSAAELNRFYDATGYPAADQRASIASGMLRAAPSENVENGPAASGFPHRNIPPPPYLDATQAAQGLFGQLPPSDVPDFPSRTIPGSTTNLADPQRDPIRPVPHGDKRSEAPDGPSPASAQAFATTPAFRPDGVYSAAGNFFSALPSGKAVAAGLSPASADSFEPGFDPGTIADGMPVRRLSRRADNQSHLSPVDEAAAPIVPDEHVGSRQAYDILERQAGPYPGATSGGWSLPDVPQSSKLAGLVSGEPMAFYAVPPPIFFPEAATGGDEDWLAKLLADRYRGYPQLDRIDGACSAPARLTRRANQWH